MSVPSALESQMLDLINQERTDRGLQPLTFDLLLNDSSEDHSEWMQSSGNFSHTWAGWLQCDRRGCAMPGSNFRAVGPLPKISPISRSAVRRATKTMS